MPPMPATTSRRKRASHKVLVVTALILSGLACAAVAQDDYPNRPLRIVVGFTPGGGPDITARHIAQRLGESLKQQVIVENRPGAGGTVVAGMVARSPADGYTLLSVSSAHAVAAAIYPKLAYDTLKDLAGVTQTATSKYVLVAAPSACARCASCSPPRERAPARSTFHRRAWAAARISPPRSSRRWRRSTWCTFRTRASPRRSARRSPVACSSSWRRSRTR